MGHHGTPRPSPPQAPMSSTNRAAVRRPADYYPTPPWCTALLLEELDLPGGRWLEPCSGNGDIVRTVSSLRDDVTWHTGDIRPEGRSVADHPKVARHAEGDFLSMTPPEVPYDVLLTNPPYSLAMEFVQHGLLMADHVVMLLRLNFLASGRRAAFMRAHTPSVYVLPNRPSFTGKGTDSIEYAWLHWRRVEGGPAQVRVLRAVSAGERRGLGQHPQAS